MRRFFSPLHTARSLVVFGVVLALVTFSLAAWTTLNVRSEAWERSQTSAANLTLALERDIERNIAAYDLSLQGAIEAYGLPDIWSIAPATRQATLFDRATSGADLGSILILNANGDIVADSTSLLPHMLNLKDRDYFQVQEQAGQGLYLSRPFKSKLRQGSPSIALSRRLPDDHGRFAGIVVGSMNLSFFQNLFANMKLGNDGIVSLFQTDGTLVARHPAQAADLGSSVASSDALRVMLASSSGHFVRRSLRDGVERLYSYRKIENAPLILAVGLSTARIDAMWMSKAITDACSLLVLCIATISLCILFQREMLRRIRAEKDLRDTADELAILAGTDALTGLGNRRAFDTMLGTEWRRSHRNYTSLALLMLDADWFKSFNDQYGHQEGDQALGMIAGAIEQNIRRPGDFAGRYGGEEFVVILPETDRAGAIFIAERIRRAVSTAAVLHQGSPFRQLSVSVGVAITDAISTASQEVLLERADQALYAAKHAGRNRVFVFSEDGPISAFDLLGKASTHDWMQANRSWSA